MNPIHSIEWKKILMENIKWEQPIVNIYGRKYLVPRKTIFLGEKNIKYRYSGVFHKAIGWPSWFYPLLNMVCLASESQFNGCLINLYRNGSDRMGWHSDNEKELDHTKSIASLSLGSSRDFYFKHRKFSHKHLITLNNGDLLLMHPPCQNEWMHSVPARKKNHYERINLTFRSYI